MPEVPKDALRSVVAGIGRILNFADKVRGKSSGAQPAEAETPVDGKARETAAPEAAAPETAAPEADAAETTAPEAGAPETAAPETAASSAATGEEKPDAAAGEDEPETAAPESGAELPLANYEELTIQSVRARLRNLSVAQLRQLIEYEKGHADRTEFVTAFERRIVKVESGK